MSQNSLYLSILMSLVFDDIFLYFTVDMCLFISCSYVALKKFLIFSLFSSAYHCHSFGNCNFHNLLVKLYPFQSN